MKSHSKLIVTATELLDNDDGIDAGLVLVTAESIHHDAICTVTFLGNIRDGWCISNQVDAVISWPSEGPEDEHVLERSFSADGLDPSDFTDESVDNARIVEDEF